MDILLGQVLRFVANPFEAGPDALRVEEAVVIDGGKIIAVGAADELRASYPQARTHDYGSRVISAGFIDAHVHYPQTAIIASWGKRLIDWLDTYTFPEEMQFKDPAYATEIAARIIATSYGVL